MLLAASWWNQHQGVIGLVGLILGVLGILIAVITVWYQRATKALKCEVLTDEGIPTAATGGPPGLAVHWMERVLYNPRLITVRIANGGKLEIRAEDFEKALVLRVPGLRVIFAGPVRLSDPDREPPKVSWNEKVDTDECYVQPWLYNRRDYVDVQLLTDVIVPDLLSDQLDWVPRPYDNKPDEVRAHVVIAGQTKPLQVNRSDLTTALSSPGIFSAMGDIFYETGRTIVRMFIGK